MMAEKRWNRGHCIVILLNLKMSNSYVSSCSSSMVATERMATEPMCDAWWTFEKDRTLREMCEWTVRDDECADRGLLLKLDRIQSGTCELSCNSSVISSRLGMYSVFPSRASVRKPICSRSSRVSAPENRTFRRMFTTCAQEM